MLEKVSICCTSLKHSWLGGHNCFLGVISAGHFNLIPPGVHMPPNPEASFPCSLGSSRRISRRSTPWRISRRSTPCTQPNSVKSHVSQIPLGCGLRLLSQTAGPRALSPPWSTSRESRGVLHTLAERCKASAPSSFKNTLARGSWDRVKATWSQSSINNRQMVSQSLGPSPSTKNNLSEGIKVSTTVTKSLLKYLPAWRNAEGAWHRVFAYLQGCFKE